MSHRRPLPIGFHLWALLLMLGWLLPGAVVAEFAPVTDPAFQVVQARPVFDRRNRVYLLDVTVTHTGSVAAPGSYRLVVASANKTAVTPDGTTAANEPFYDLLTGDGAAFAAGATMPRRLSFTGGRGQLVATLRLERELSAPPPNQPPVAEAGPDQTRLVGDTATLDGSASSDPDGDTLTYAWALNSVPAGSGAFLDDPKAVMPSFYVDAAGEYLVALIVNDGALDSAADQVRVSTSNSAPVADAGPDRSGQVGDQVQLDGSKSSDADGDALTYTWSFTQRPTDSTAAFDDSSAAQPSFSIDMFGDYVAQLVVNDGTEDSAPDTVAISTLNTPPVANAGADRSGLFGQTIQLDGSGSSDVDGHALSYSWSFTSRPVGSNAAFDDPASLMPSFPIDVSGSYVAQLIVNDGFVDSAPDSVVITTGNTAPLADAGSDQAVDFGDLVTLDGSGSTDVDGDALTYSWSFASRPGGTLASLSDPTAVMPQFTADLPGDYIAQLIVNDGLANSAPDSVVVSTGEPPAPTANAGIDQAADLNDLVTLDGSGSSDPIGLGLTYIWTLVSQPAGSTATLDDALTPSPSFTVDAFGDYVVQLIVNNGFRDSAPDTVTISTANLPPVANAGPDQNVAAGATVQLDGTASSDPDGLPVAVKSWSLLSVPSGSGATLSNADTLTPTFVADLPGTYVAQLIVNDGALDSAPDTVAVMVSPANNPPALVTVGDRVTFVGASLAFRIFAIDPDAGDTLTFDLPTAPAGASIDPASGDFVYDAPLSPTLETVTVRVTDAGGLSDVGTFSIDVRALPILPAENAPPTLAPIGPRSILVGQALSIQTIASDPDAGDTLSYTLPGAPAGMTISLSGLIGWTPAVIQVGAHDVTVQVTDAAGAAALQSTIVTVVAPNRPPVAVDDLYDARIGETTSVPTPGVMENDSDPDGDALSATLVTTTANGVLDFRPDGSFDYTPGLPETIGPVELELHCEAPPQYVTNGTVAVGDVDNDGATEMVGVGNISSGTLRDLWILDADCVPQAVPNLAAMIAAGGFTDRGHLGLLDIDGDGDLEIIGVRAIVPGVGFDGEHLLAVHHDGSLAWPGDGASETTVADIGNSSDGAFSQMGPTFADIDGNGTVEIIMPWYRSAGIGGGVIQGGVTVFNSADGTILWEFLAGAQQFGDSDYKPPVVVDLDLDGTMEIIYHTNVIDHTGALEFLLPVQLTGGWSSHLTTAVANFDPDTYPEIIAIDQRNHYLFNHDGTVIFQNPVPNNSQSQITVADFDGDGEVEYAWYAGLGSTLTRGYFQVYDANGSLLWSHQGLDQFGEELTRFKGVNATAFDTNGDGAADLVVHLDVYTPVTEDVDGVYIFDGRDGSLMEFVQIGSNAAEQRFTTIVDLDDDGAAEIISSRTSGLVNQTRVWRGTSANPLPSAPSVRNQWMFDQTRIDETGNTLTDPEPGWLQPGRNGYNLISDPQRVYTQTKCERPNDFGTNGTMAVGDVDNDGEIELVGITTKGATADFFILNPNDCSVELGGAPPVIAAGGLAHYSHPGLLDIDGDGDLEIIARRLRFPDGGFDSSPTLIAAHHDGTLAWPGDGGTESSGRNFGSNQSNAVGPQFADLDGDGAVEILISWAIGCSGLTCSGVTAYNSADGSLKWEYQGEQQRANAYNKPVTIADLDLDGTMEVIVHSHVISHDGEFEFRLPVTAYHPSQPLWASHLYTAVANFDDDPYPEIIARDTNRTYLFEHDGSIKWQVLRDTHSSSPITIADFDGDGQVEYAYMGGDYSSGTTGTLRYLEVYDTDGSPLWSHADRDRFKEDQATAAGFGQGVVAFDANDDGAYDLVVNLGERHGAIPLPGDRTGVHIFSGRDGSSLEFIPVNRYFNTQRFPVVADVDGDGEAELISSFDAGITATILVVEGTEAKPLPPAPPLRSQWHFHEAYVNDDASIPANPTPPWLRPELHGWHMIERAPDPLAGTTDSFTYRASDGQATSNLATVSLDVQPAGTPPAFLSQPDTLTTVGFPYEHASRVIDLDPGDVVTLSLAAAPPGMTLSSTGRLTWTPDAVGEYGVSILASDTIGFTTVQSFTLAVGEPVTVPDVVGSPRSTAEDTLEGVNLLVGQVREATHPTVPAGTIAEQSPPGGAVAEFGGEVDLVVSRGPGPEDLDGDGDGFTPNQGDCDDGNRSVFPGAADDPADGIDANCDGIDGDLPLESILVSLASSTVLVGQPVSLTATAVFDDGTAQNLTGVVAWTNGPSFSSATPGTFTATASRDGVSGSATIQVVTSIAGDQVPPTASISAPAADSTVTQPVDVTGTATDGNFLKYELAYAPAGETDFTPIAVSAAPVTGGVLGRFDPTLLINDLYTLRLTVYDRGGNQTVEEITVQVDGDLKVGNFTLGFTDLAIPMAGVPITVTRTYDSREQRSGDFGVGWFLDLQTLRLRTNRVLGTGWQVLRSGLSYGLIANDAHTVSLTLPDGRVEQFELVVSPSVSPIVPFPPLSQRVSYQPRPGTLGKLESLEDDNVSILDSQPGVVNLTVDSSGDVYDPQRFRYTAADGTQIEINKSDGVERIIDPNGNTLTFGPNGITHSAGKSVTFERDAQGRITKITDPKGNSQSYSYDANGDLRSHTDAEGYTTRFDYNRSHGLIQITDPLDRPLARNEYDANGRIVRITNGDGRVIDFGRDVDNRQEIITDVDGSITVLEYDERGNVLKVTDPLGNTTTSTYDADGNQLSTTNPLDETTTRTFDARNNLLTETDPLGNTTTFTYNAQDKVTSLTDALGRSTTYTYDNRGNRLTESDALGNVTTNAYDAAGNLIAQTDALGQTVQFGYDSFGNQTSRTDARGNTETSAFDANGNPVGETDRRGFTVTTRVDARGLFVEREDPLGHTTMFDWNAAGVLTAVTDPGGNSTRVERDALGKEVSVVDALGYRTEKSYDLKGNLTVVEDALDRSTAYGYDGADRRISTTLPDGAVSETRYDAPGRIVEQEDALGNVTAYEYDAAGRNTKVIDALGNETRYHYDAGGNLIGMTDANGNDFAYEYDLLDRRIRTTYPDGTFTETGYDANGQVISETDALGRITSFDYDPNGNLIRVTDPLGGETSFTYDADDNLIAQTDARGNATTFNYDANGRRIGKTYPDGTTETQAYDAAGRIATRTDSNGATTVFEYDANGRFTRKTFADGSAETFTYSPTGQMLGATNSYGTVTYVYDANGRLIRLENPDGSAIAYTYDAVGNRTSDTIKVSAIAPSRTTSYTYDVLNRVGTVTDPDGQVTTHAYDIIGNLASITYPNAVVSSYTYDANSRLIELSHANASETLARYVYQVNAVGDRTKVSDAADGGHVDYTYDDLRRLTRESHYDFIATKIFELQYDHDAVGNRTTLIDIGGNTTVYSYDAADKLLAAGDTSYGYDAKGNLRAKRGPTGEATYRFDPENQLTGVTTPSATIGYAYDANGERIQRSDGTATTSYLVDPVNTTGYAQVLADYDAGRIDAQNIFASQLLSRDDGIQNHYYHHDASRNVRLLTNTAGQSTDSYVYTAFGEVTARTGGTENVYTFAGERFDPAGGLTYLRARHYDPSTGRFVNRDPFEGALRDPLSLHRYLYANSNPIAFRDPSGMNTLPEMLAITLLKATKIGMVAGTVGATIQTISTIAEVRGQGRKVNAWKIAKEWGDTWAKITFYTTVGAFVAPLALEGWPLVMAVGAGKVLLDLVLASNGRDIYVQDLYNEVLTAGFYSPTVGTAGSVSTDAALTPLGGSNKAKENFGASMLIGMVSSAVGLFTGIDAKASLNQLLAQGPVGVRPGDDLNKVIIRRGSIRTALERIEAKTLHRAALRWNTYWARR